METDQITLFKNLKFWFKAFINHLFRVRKRQFSPFAIVFCRSE